MPKPPQRSTYPEPGAWTVEDRPGLPTLKYPHRPAVEMLSGVQVLEHVTYEGLGFCIWHFIPAERIKDEKLRKLWVEARQALGKVLTYLENLPKERLTEKERKQRRRRLGIGTRAKVQEDHKPRRLSIGREIELES